MYKKPFRLVITCNFYAIGGATLCAEIDTEAAIGDVSSSYCSIVL